MWPLPDDFAFIIDFLAPSTSWSKVCELSPVKLETPTLIVTFSLPITSFLVGVGQQQGKLVATVACSDINIAHDTSDQLANLFKDFVTDHMAIFTVDSSEIINVE